ncbi:anthrone oxygenase family protein [Streptomyces albidoflavus]|uniref:anthrone oxygenase family protein n=1 Tax=Streptomyces albidoflavus TaxID=1886 RepID=UPI0008F4A9EB|nr:anthrone oxygenase family protein [Streptomyces albidoflavus]
MSEGVFAASAVVAAVGSGVVAGVFFAFSTSVMRTLAGLPAAQGITAMQRINVVIVKGWFLAVFLGTAALSAVLAVLALVLRPENGLVVTVLGAALYLVGGFGVTVAANVPRNDRLAALDAEDPGSEAPWREFVAEWTVWNHVRGAACAAACACFAAAPLG